MTYESEKETDDVYKSLTDTDSTEDLLEFIKDLEISYPDMSFIEHDGEHYANEERDFKGNRQALARLSQVDKDYIYQIISGRRMPDRDRIIALCLAIGMTDRECIRCLERSNYGILYAKNKRDAVIIYAFRNQLSVLQLNAKLDELGLKPLAVSKR